VANLSKFDEMDGGKPAACEVCEAMLPDAVDGLLSPGEQRAFDTHIAGCVVCSHELEAAQRGAAWLAMLKSQTPEVPAGLLTKILEGTTGGAAEINAATAQVSEARPGAPGFVPVQTAAPAWAISSLWRRAVIAFGIDGSRMTFQPRLAMTAAMAFFSIALTLNLAGVHLNDLHAADFTPSGMQRKVSDMSASATRSFQNMRVVYQVESRVSELRGTNELGAERDSLDPEREQPSSPVQKEEPKQQPEQQTPTQKVPQGHSDLTLPQPQRIVYETAAPRKAA